MTALDEHVGGPEVAVHHDDALGRRGPVLPQPAGDVRQLGLRLDLGPLDLGLPAQDLGAGRVVGRSPERVVEALAVDLDDMHVGEKVGQRPGQRQPAVEPQPERIALAQHSPMGPSGRALHDDRRGAPADVPSDRRPRSRGRGSPPLAAPRSRRPPGPGRCRRPMRRDRGAAASVARRRGPWSEKAQFSRDDPPDRRRRPRTSTSSAPSSSANHCRSPSASRSVPAGSPTEVPIAVVTGQHHVLRDPVPGLAVGGDAHEVVGRVGAAGSQLVDRRRGPTPRARGSARPSSAPGTSPRSRRSPRRGGTPGPGRRLEVEPEAASADELDVDGPADQRRGGGAVLPGQVVAEAGQSFAGRRPRRAP